MIFQSTRNPSIKADSPTAILTGLSPDGGLFVPAVFPENAFDTADLDKMDFRAISTRILSILFDDFDNPGQIVETSYNGKFLDPSITPLLKVGDKYLLNLYLGPTSAFKDVALSMLPVLISESEKKLKTGKRTLILTATSGDTGKAALEGFKDRGNVSIIVFYPSEGVSAVQKAQMCTQEGKNVKVCAVKGNFDDCQSAVKKAFTALDASLPAQIRLSSANSINIGRLVPQISYYFFAYAELLRNGAIKKDEEIDFVVPTGNFGDILAGYWAKKLGLPVGKLVCASNSNNVLSDFLKTGVYDRRREFHKTASPSMDILISSNLERLIFDVAGAQTTARCMAELGENGVFTLPPDIMEQIRRTFGFGWASEEQTASAIGETYKNLNCLIDPHTAVAYSVANRTQSGRKTVVLSTASPFKFPAFVLRAIGEKPGENELGLLTQLKDVTGAEIPPNLAKLIGNPPVLHKDLIERDSIADYVREAIRRA